MDMSFCDCSMQGHGLLSLLADRRMNAKIHHSMQSSQDSLTQGDSIGRMVGDPISGKVNIALAPVVWP